MPVIGNASANLQLQQLNTLESVKNTLQTINDELILHRSLLTQILSDTQASNSSNNQLIKNFNLLYSNAGKTSTLVDFDINTASVYSEYPQSGHVWLIQEIGYSVKNLTTTSTLTLRNILTSGSVYIPIQNEGINKFPIGQGQIAYGDYGLPSDFGVTVTSIGSVAVWVICQQIPIPE